MRAIWMPSLFTRYSPDIEYIKKVLPDIVEMVVIFPKFSVNSRFEPHLAEECKFTFNNGRTLNIPGFMLWKFLDMIPEALGSEEAGYFDHNMFTSDHGERLMKRIRSAYQAMFIDTPPKGRMTPPPVRSILNLRSGEINVEWMPKLSDASEKYLGVAFIDSIESSSQITKQIADVVLKETSEPQFELGFKDIGNGMLGREIVRKPWPDLSAMKFEEFLRCLSASKQDNCPAQKSQRDLFSEVILSACDEHAEAFVSGLRKTPGYSKIAKELGCTSEKPMAKTFLKHLSASENAFVFFESMWSHIYKQLKEKSVKEVISMSM